MRDFISQRVKELQPSATVRLMSLAKQMKEEGQDIINLAGGEPDFKTPSPIIERAYTDMKAGFTSYIQSQGLPELRRKYDLYCVTVAHIGDGNIHVLPLNNKGLSPEEWFNKIKAFHHDLFPRVYALGGKMSGEHGIGFKKLEEFEACTPEGELKMIRAIKKALDPNDIMNPGKLVNVG